MNIIKNIRRPVFNSFLYFNVTLSKCRLINSSTLKFSNYSKNPFQKKQFNNFLKNNSKEVTRICVTILGNGAVGQPRCIGLFTDHKTILFNCGEGVGRLLREYEAIFHNIKYAFITQNKWHNVSGLADIHITHDAYGIYKLNLFGPPNVEQFASLLTASISMTKLDKRNTPYVDDTFEINSISIVANHPFKSIKRAHKGFEDVVFSYSCKIIGKPAKLIPEKLVEHNVPLGPHLLKLKNGEDIVLPCGRTVHCYDVIDSYMKEEIFLVVDCPSEIFLSPFVTNDELSQYQLPSDVAHKVTTIFHFTPPHIMETKIYQKWMKRFHSETQHVILNASCSNLSSEAVYHTQSIFHLLHPDIFKLLPNAQKENQSFITSSVIRASPMLQINFWPKKSINSCNVVNYEEESFLQKTELNNSFHEELKTLKALTATKLNCSIKEVQDYPEVIFFGTSSSTSSAYRNVTSILLNINSGKSFLLDCGESAYMQMVRYFGQEDVNFELRKISCIFISHLHTDHYLGLFHFIKKRCEAFETDGFLYQPVMLILPFKIRNLFTRFCEIYEPLLSKTKIFNCKAFKADQKKPEKLENFLGDIEIETVPVRHCVDAYGIVIKNDLNWKIVYSGDTAPCQKLIDAGDNCSLLIHEASIEDGCMNEAIMRKHSTPSQVLDIAQKMNAQHTIMTHFSKRYLAVPVFEESDSKSIGCAFDFMKVRLHELPLVPLFLPAMKCLFHEQLEEHSERTSHVVNFENSFLNSYKLKAKS